jgi:Spy/CpxP family protein refolding chaperone
MKKTLIGFCGALALAALATVTMAATPGVHGAMHHGPANGEMMDRMADHIASALNLNAQQKTAVGQLMADMHAKAEPLMEQQHQQWEDVEALLDAGNPDATEVGNRVIAAYATRAQLKALHEGLKTKLLALLNDEQKAKALELEQKMHGDGPGFGPGFGQHGPQH